IGRESGEDPGRVPTISFKVSGKHSGEIARSMDEFKLAIRFGDFHARRLIEYLGIEGDGGVVRVSMAHYNTVDEVDALIEAIETILSDVKPPG
ncbi:MAG: aminotransferase class V-fold PLP-dependent enzyme, partial [Pseudomonadota bacterium]